MAKENQELLLEYIYLKRLLNNHHQQAELLKLQNQKTKLQPNLPVKIASKQANMKEAKLKQAMRIVNLPQQSRPSTQVQRIVVNPSKKRLVVNSTSTPKSTKCPILSPMLSPLPNANNPLENINITFKNTQFEKNDRIVLKSSRFKWSSKFKSPKLDLQSSNLKLHNPSKQQKNTSKILTKKAKTPIKIIKVPELKQNVNKYKFFRSSSSTSPRKLLRSNTIRTNPKFVRMVNRFSVNNNVVRDKKLLRKVFKNHNVPTKLNLSSKRGITLHSFSKNNNSKQKIKIYKNGKMENFILIGGILYNSSRNKLSRAGASGLKEKTMDHNSTLNTKMITVRGIKYSLDPFGKTLKRVNASSPTKRNDLNRVPDLSRIDIGGETFIQTKPGLLVLSQANKTRTIANRSINRSINRLVAAKKKSKQFCLFFNKFGKCTKHDLGTCPYLHDPDKVAVCTRFLQGKCSVESCPFSHKICSRKMPVCRYFMRGLCNADNCPYNHVNVNPKADNCEAFLKGFCSLGEKCKKLHSNSCAEFKRTGKCSKTKCQLRHESRKKRKLSIKIDLPLVENDSSSSTVTDYLSSPGVSCKPQKEMPTKLPSFIKLEDTFSELNDTESMISTPLRIKPNFS